MVKSYFEKFLAIILSFLVIFFTLSTAGDTFQRRSIFLMLVCIYCFFKYPFPNSFGKNIQASARTLLRAIDFILMLVTIGAFSYVYYYSKDLLWASGTATKFEVILGYIAVFLILEATRRAFGKAVVILCIVFLIYAFFGQYTPSFFHHPGFTAKRISMELFLTFNGLFSLPLFVFLKYVFLFIFFGSMLEVSGGADFFIKLAKSLVGHVTGGPAKIAVVSSGLLGMLSGSVIANVVGTGSVTIPMMKKMGYNRNFAAGVESAASTGGQLMPPVMGAAIFIMVELTGISYFKICINAVFPAILYYLSIFMIVHFVSVKNNLVGLPKNELPALFDTLKQCYYFIPVIILVVMMGRGISTETAVMYSIVILFILTFLTRESRLFSKDKWLLDSKFMEVIEVSARRACPISVAGAAIGIVLGIMGLSGFSLKISAFLLQVSGESMLIALILTMILALIFGMGMDTVTVYILLSVLLAPGIVQLGTTVVAAHLFIFYFGMMAMVTPPVCLAAYVAAGIADGDAMKAGFWGWRLALAAFLIPYSFIYDPAILLIGKPVDVVIAVITGFIGVVALAGAVAGHMRKEINYIERTMLLIAAVLLIKVGIISGIIGIALMIPTLAKQYVLKA